MGYFRHKAIVVHHYDNKTLEQVHAVAKFLFTSENLGPLVTDIVPVIINDGGSFMIGVDGSKEGWETSDKYDAAAEKLFDWMDTAGVSYAEVIIGGDDDDYVVESHSRSDHNDL